ncbi:4-hydroxythreonine-4-phosphate dehydrogenase [Bacteroidales bacterium KA00251]|nr:4-hydroxythreonine-4-phosphate dehydrogenase [Bacteroidales bacterium KA00251]
MNEKAKIAFTHGDINGISYEILLKLLSTKDITKLFTPIVYGSAKVSAYYRKVLEMDEMPWNRIENPREASESEPNLINCVSDDLIVEMGKATPEAGIASYEALEVAMKDLLAGEVDALVTAPINKSIMPHDRFPYKGHTAYLGAKCHLEKGQSPLMILMADRLKVALVTEHIPLSEVSKTLTKERIVAKVKELHSSLIRDFAIDNPRIAVLALNPHAGDIGLIGDEEKRIILPAVEECRSNLAIKCFGPYPSDGFWGSSMLMRFDGVVAMYHDQGLAPFKALYMDSGVNFTAGLPIVRTSPDHGVGYDIVGKGIASEESLREATYTAIDVLKNRREHDLATRNPLRKTYYASNNSDNEVLPPIATDED